MLAVLAIGLFAALTKGGKGEGANRYRDREGADHRPGMGRTGKDGRSEQPKANSQQPTAANAASQ